MSRPLHGKVRGKTIELDEDLGVPEGQEVEVRVKVLHASSATQRFRELVRQWQKETAHLSVVSRMAAHPAYRGIVGMGRSAVPLLLAELRRKPDHWFIALEEITGARPVPPESEGKIKEMAEAWIRWGEREGHLA
jgi:hypothetical protein